MGEHPGAAVKSLAARQLPREDGRVTGAGSLMRGHDAFDRIEEKFNEALDPAGPEVLYEYVAGMELPAGATAIDIGCGEGKQAIELSRRFGLQVTGIDPVTCCVEVALRNAQPGGNVSFDVGAAENLPVANASADLVWCRDVLCLAGDLGRAYREFRRVLKPGGRRALIYQMFATSLLEPGEAAVLLPVLGCSPAAMRPESTEAAINDAGLRIDRCVILGTEWGEYAQEHAQHPGRHLLHAARLIRDPDRYIARFGQENYDIKLGDCLWHIYRMIGKLSSRVYLLSAPGQAVR
jgi:SAM-dependent methyltransferase